MMSQDVLIVDDSATIRQMVKKTMEMANVMIQLDRQATIQRLTKAGVVIVDWDQSVPLEKSLEGLKRPLNVM